ncbi:MAG: patatin-like phospholipase family protein [Candidatus Cloacimonetes bacterium]|nr:patatin-like phospholipase family protein [Candidatus Cloacimonadota bacterium]
MSEKKKATVVLGGGSALGLAHIGVLSVLEQHYEINAILGTSMGAIVGALYAAGMSIAEILEIAGRNSNAKIFSPLNLDKHITGIFDGSYMLKLFNEWTSEALIENGVIPYMACAYDLKSRSTILFNRGKYADAMRASSSLPLIFAPYTFHNYILVDGGIEHPLPLSYTGLFTSDLVVAVNVLPMVEHQAKLVEFSTVNKHKKKLSFRSEIVMQSVFQNQASMALKDIISYEPDIVIDAALPDGRAFAFHKSIAFYDYGRKQAIKTIEDYREPSFLDIIRKHYLALVSKSNSIKL